MKKVKASLAGLILATIIIASCTKLMPSPEVEITNVNPVALTGRTDDANYEIEFTFKNKNNVDAVITRERISFHGSITDVDDKEITFYVPANSESKLTLYWDTLSFYALRSYIGSDANGNRTMTFTYSGTDAYGDNHTFNVRDFTISF